MSSDSSCQTIIYCPSCTGKLEELDCTTFYCVKCERQFQIEEEISKHLLNNIELTIWKHNVLNKIVNDSSRTSITEEEQE